MKQRKNEEEKRRDRKRTRKGEEQREIEEREGGRVQGPMKGGNEMPRRRKEACRSLSDNWSIYIELEFVAHGDGDTLTIDERRRRSRRRGTVPDESDGESEMSECDANV